MKKLTLLVLLALVTASAGAKSVRLPIRATEDRQHVPVVFHLDDYPEFSLIERSMLGVYLPGRESPSQLDDLHSDGIADELAVLVDMKKGEQMTLVIQPKKRHKSFEKQVHAEMYIKSKTPKDGFTYHEAEGKQFYICPVQEQTFYPGEDSYHSMHHHGVAFESDLMAYRIYFDKKQTIDVYAKKTPRLELDACKWYPTDAQLTEGFGDDILRVSGMIGVGACKPYNGKKMVHFDEVESRTERIVSQGAVRTICEIEAKGWQTEDGRKVDVITRYTLYAHHRDVMVEVFFSEPVETMCTGVQQIGKANFFTALPEGDSAAKSAQDVCSKGAIVASWGTAFPVNDSIKYGKETAGLAVYVPEKYYKQKVSDPRNNLVLLQPGRYIRYYFTVVSLKENNPPAQTDAAFWLFCKEWAEALEE